MKPIQKNELYQHLSGFLKSRGVHLQDGSYTEGIKKGCGLLTEAINVSQKGLHRAKDGLNDTLDQMRQTIHKQTAPNKKTASSSKNGNLKAKPRAKKPAHKKRSKA